MSPAMLLASHNAHKRDEIQRTLCLPPGFLRSPADLDRSEPPPNPDENGQTYAANARIKARAFSHWSKLPALADDSGLEVAALGGRPGLHTARYAGPNATFAAHCQRLLEELEGTADSARQACFICVLVICVGDDVVWETEGRCPGFIPRAPAGDGGFGYDPVFIPEHETCTLAQMTAADKDRISHRGRALKHLGAALAAGEIAGLPALA